jgi:uncharacterized membrane protein
VRSCCHAKDSWRGAQHRDGPNSKVGHNLRQAKTHSSSRRSQDKLSAARLAQHLELANQVEAQTHENMQLAAVCLQQWRKQQQ